MKYMEGTNMTEAIEQERFVVANDAQAEWAIAKIRQVRAETKRWTEYYGQQLAAIRAENEATERYMLALLEGYFDIVPHKHSRTQESYQLPGGKLVRKQQKPEFSRDEEALCGWLEDNGYRDMVQTVVTHRADWAALKPMLKAMGDGAVATQDGEIVDGVTAYARADKFMVEGMCEGE